MNAQDVEGDTPLHLALGNNYTNCVFLLLDKGADFLSMRNSAGGTAYDIARRENMQEILSCMHLLCCQTEDLSLSKKEANDLLCIATKTGNLRGIVQALDNKADINAIFDDDAAALHYSVRANNIDCVNVLLSRGADVNLKKTCIVLS